MLQKYGCFSTVMPWLGLIVLYAFVLLTLANDDVAFNCPEQCGLYAPDDKVQLSAPNISHHNVTPHRLGRGCTSSAVPSQRRNAQKTKQKVPRRRRREGRMTVRG